MAHDEITLRVPRDRQFFSVAHLVFGGLAVRLNLTLETLEDLQVALAGLLERADGTSELTLRVRVADEELEAEVGPFAGDGIEQDLQRKSEHELGLRRILDTVVDGVAVDRRDDGTWVVVRKGLPG